MSNKKILLCLLTVVLITSTASPAKLLAAEKKVDSKGPIVVEADELYFSDFNGDVHAKGNVTVTQDAAQIVGDLLRGNTKSNEIWVDDQATYTELSTKLVGDKVHYNYKTHEGTMKNATGRVDKELVRGQDIDMKPQEVIIHYGTATRCPAKVPDYHVSGDKVEIWPGEKMIIYNAKFWIKKTVIFSMPKYQVSLKDGQSEFPVVGYNNHDGVSIRQNLEYPLADHLSAFFQPAWYSKSGFKPSYGVRYNQSGYKLSVVSGDFVDTDNHWIKKEPEVSLTFGNKVGNLPIDYSFSATAGKWTDDYKSSWHQDYSLYFSGHPIKISKVFELYLGTGFEKILESYGESTNNIFKYDATLYESWTPKLQTFVGYHYKRNNNTLFAYDSSDLAKELDAGLTYKLDRMNSIGYSQSYDLNSQRIYDQDYYWYRDLHCWEMTVQYRARRHEYNVSLTTKRF